MGENREKGKNNISSKKQRTRHLVIYKIFVIFGVFQPIFIKFSMYV